MGQVGNLGEIGLQRTADGVLHVLWPREGGPTEHQVLHSAIPANGKGVVGPNLVFSNSSELGSVNSSVDLLAGPGGGLRADLLGDLPGCAIRQRGDHGDLLGDRNRLVGACRRLQHRRLPLGLRRDRDLRGADRLGRTGLGLGLARQRRPLRARSTRRRHPRSPTNCCVDYPNVGVDSLTGAAVIAQAGPGEGLVVSGAVPAAARAGLRVAGGRRVAARRDNRPDRRRRRLRRLPARRSRQREAGAVAGWICEAARWSGSPAGSAQEVTLAPAPGRQAVDRLGGRRRDDRPHPDQPGRDPLRPDRPNQAPAWHQRDLPPEHGGLARLPRPLRADRTKGRRRLLAPAAARRPHPAGEAKTG